MALAVAVIVIVPGATPVARPVLVMLATAVPLELQLAEFVMSCVLPSLNMAVAVNC
jgi:hypothetical protein